MEIAWRLHLIYKLSTMKKTLAVLILLFGGFVVFAQVAPTKMSLPDIKSALPPLRKDTNLYKTYKSNYPPDSLYHHLRDAKEGQLLYIVNSNIITGLNYINPNDITSITVLKDQNIPANLVNLSRFGVVFITLKKEVKIETNTFSDIKNRFNIDGKVQFAVDGYFVDDENMLISTKDIDEINITWKKSIDRSSQVIVNIWMLAPEARKGIVYAPNPNDKPGTIRIRGLASN